MLNTFTYIYERDSSILSCYELMFKQSKLNVKTFSSFSKFIEEFQIFKPQLIILDYWLDDPIVEDFIKSNFYQSLVGVPVIITSTLVKIDFLNLPKSITLIPKPFSLEYFMSTVTEKMDRPNDYVFSECI
jgi:DNA-binding NtrC family response regulator